MHSVLNSPALDRTPPTAPRPPPGSQVGQGVGRQRLQVDVRTHKLWHAQRMQQEDEG